MAAVFGSIGVFGFLFVIFLLILWTLLPFAVFGVKARLDRQVNLLTDIRNELRRINAGEKNGRENPEPTPRPNIESTAESQSDEPEQEVSLNDLYSDPAAKWFKRHD